jgi:hypothetical protein
MDKYIKIVGTAKFLDEKHKFVNKRCYTQQKYSHFDSESRQLLI